MSDKYVLDNAELERHLDEQLGFLQRSADSFDDGDETEAKRLALGIRILCHDTKSSKSLLGRLSRKSIRFLDTAFDYDSTNKLSHSGLVAITMNPSGPRFSAMLDDSPIKKEIDFEEWWSMPVFSDKEHRVLSRKQLIVIAANQNGGAHVDGELDSTYAALAKSNALDWNVADGTSIHPLEGPERAAIRQIAHELLKTLIPGYIKRPKSPPGAIFGGVSIVEAGPVSRNPSQPSPKNIKIGRNEPCPCGSGMKYKKCHGR